MVHQHKNRTSVFVLFHAIPGHSMACHKTQMTEEMHKEVRDGKLRPAQPVFP